MTTDTETSREVVPVPSPDLVADAMRRPFDDPDRIEAIIQAIAAQRQAILDLIPILMDKWSRSFLGFFDEHMDKILARQADVDALAHNEREMLRAKIDEAHDRMMNYVQAYTLRADVGVREVRLEYNEALDALAERVTANEQAIAVIQKHLGLDAV